MAPCRTHSGAKARRHSLLHSGERWRAGVSLKWATRHLVRELSVTVCVVNPCGRLVYHRRASRRGAPSYDIGSFVLDPHERESLLEAAERLLVQADNLESANSGKRLGWQTGLLGPPCSKNHFETGRGLIATRRNLLTKPPLLSAHRIPTQPLDGQPTPARAPSAPSERGPSILLISEKSLYSCSDFGKPGFGQIGS
jgi:hypothetical protein